MTHDERVYHHLYVESKSPLENAERIASLEELVLDLYDFALDAEYANSTEWSCYLRRIRELGVTA